MLYLHTFSDTHWPKWLAFFLIAIGIFSVHYGRRYHWTLTPVLFTSLTSALMAYEPNIQYFKYNPIAQISIATNAAESAIYILLVVFILDYVRKVTLRKIVYAYEIMIAANAVYVLFQYFIQGLGHDWVRGFLPNASIGPTLMGLFAGASFHSMLMNQGRKAVIHCTIVTAAVIVSGSSMGYLTMIAGMSAGILLYLHRKGYSWATPITALIFVGLWYVGYTIDGQWGAFQDRTQFWTMYYEWWIGNDYKLWGTGPGTFNFFGPNIQDARKLMMDKGVWPWAHSDVFQIIFETGVLGTVSALMFYLNCLWTAFKCKCDNLVVLYVAIFVAMLGNYPLRIAEFSFLITVLFAFILKERKHE